MSSFFFFFLTLKSWENKELVSDAYYCQVIHIYLSGRSALRVLAAGGVFGVGNRNETEGEIQSLISNNL